MKRATGIVQRQFSTFRAKNFNAGPAGLPMAVLEKAHKDFFNFAGTGMGIMEMSHRSKEFDAVAVKAEEDLCELLNVPDTHKVVFMQGGASTQMAAVPLNLLRNGKADHLVTGAWSKKAFAEAKKYGEINLAATSADKNFSYIPEPSTWSLDKDASFVHYCANETIGGVEFGYVPQTNGVPLVGDFSSTFCSRPHDVAAHDVIYAGAQKNVGPSGVTVVIVKKDVVGKAMDICPVMLDYETQVKNSSMYNTPPCWGIYMCGLVFDWLKTTQGGLEGIAEINGKKASTLYSAIELSPMYHSPVHADCRSKMNVPFRVGTAADGSPGCEDAEKAFIAQATSEGLVGLKGHRSVGGCRASIYNSVSQGDVETLVSFMHKFEKSQ